MHHFHFSFVDFLIGRLTHFTCESVKWVDVGINVYQGRLIFLYLSLSAFQSKSFAMNFKKKKKKKKKKPNQQDEIVAGRSTLLTVRFLIIPAAILVILFEDMETKTEEKDMMSFRFHFSSFAGEFIYGHRISFIKETVHKMFMKRRAP